MQWTPLAVTALGRLLIFRWGWSALRRLGVCAVVGMVAGVVMAAG